MESYLEEAARLGVDVEIERHDPYFVKAMLDELRALHPIDLPAGIRSVNDGSAVDAFRSYRTREEIAAYAYLEAYGAHPEATEEQQRWGLKCSSEDALYNVLRRLFPDVYDVQDGFYLVRNDPQMQELANRLWEDWECESMTAQEIAGHLVPAIDALRKGEPCPQTTSS